MSSRTRLSVSSLALLATTVALVACSATSDDEGRYSGSGSSRGHNAFVVTHKGNVKPMEESMRQTATVSADGHRIVVNTSSGTSIGLAQETVDIHAGHRRRVHTGKYDLRLGPFADDRRRPAAALRIEGVPGIGLPDVMQATSGELKVESYREKDGELRRIHYSYSGTFRAIDDLDKETYYVSGTVSYDHR